MRQVAHIYERIITTLATWNRENWINPNASCEVNQLNMGTLLGPMIHKQDPEKNLQRHLAGISRFDIQIYIHQLAYRTNIQH
jgi:hypothetical protein